MRRVTVVGGVERNANALARVAEELGWALDYHSGHMEGRGASDMDTYVARADLVLVATGVNSHGAMKAARAAAAKARKPLVLCHTLSPSKLGTTLRSHT